MRVKRSVFGSQPEREMYLALNKMSLPEGWSIDHNLPLAGVIHAERSDFRKESEFRYFRSTSVDFVLRNAQGTPQLVIEFDGWGRGYSSGDSYVSRSDPEDPQRQWKMQFKLDTFKKVDLPLLIVSYEEGPDYGRRWLGEEDSRCLVQSLVGQFLAKREYKMKILEWDRAEKGRGRSQYELLWDLAKLQMDCLYRWDPLLKALGRLYDSVGGENIPVSWAPVFEPDIEEALKTKTPFRWVGCRFRAQIEGDSDPVSLRVRVRNFAGKDFSNLLISDISAVEGPINPLLLAETVAQYIGYRRIAERMGLSPADT